MAVSAILLVAPAVVMQQTHPTGSEKLPEVS